MNAFAENKKRPEEGGLHMLHRRRDPETPRPPHERKSLLHVEFDDSDLALLVKVYGDEDTAFANKQVILAAPPEIQICIMQLMNMIKEVN